MTRTQSEHGRTVGVDIRISGQWAGHQAVVLWSELTRHEQALILWTVLRKQVRDRRAELTKSIH